LGSGEAGYFTGQMLFLRDYIDKLRYRSPTTHGYDIVGHTAPTISCRCHPTYSNGWQQQTDAWKL